MGIPVFPVVAAKQFTHHTAVQQGVLSHVQGHQVEPESMHAAQQSLYAQPTGMFTLVLFQAVSNQEDVGRKFIGQRIAVFRFVQRGGQPVCHQSQQAAVRHVAMPLWYQPGLPGHHFVVELELLQHFV